MKILRVLIGFLVVLMTIHPSAASTIRQAPYDFADSCTRLSCGYYTTQDQQGPTARLHPHALDGHLLLRNGLRCIVLPEPCLNQGYSGSDVGIYFTPSATHDTSVTVALYGLQADNADRTYVVLDAGLANSDFMCGCNYLAWAAPVRGAFSMTVTVPAQDPSSDPWIIDVALGNNDCYSSCKNGPIRVDVTSITVD